MRSLFKFFFIFTIVHSCEKESINNENTYLDNFQIDSSLTFHDDDLNNDVFFQSFWWDIYNDQRIGNNFYSFLEKKIEDLNSTHIDLVWLPPPSEGEGMGYHPRKLFDFNSNFGNKNQLQTLLEKMKRLKIHSMADLVINHRVGTFNWTDFTEPAWGCESICSDDEAVFDPSAFGTIPCGDVDEGDKWHGARDLNHKSTEVQQGIIDYLSRLKSLGFDSWRYDFVKGYPPRYVATYNQALPYYFSVGEYWDANTDKLKSWIEHSQTPIAGKKNNPSAAFDFPLKYNLKEAFVKFNYEVLDTQINNIGLSGDTNFKHLAVTFLDNHDTGCINRNDCNSLFSKNTAAIRRGYAYLLTHPGLPMIWGYHYFFQDSAGSLQTDLKNLIFIRKKYGINAKSEVTVLSTSNGLSGHYVAKIDEKLIIKIGKLEYTPSSEWKRILTSEEYTIWNKD